MSQPELPVNPDADAINARLRSATSSLYDHFHNSAHCRRIASIGECPVGKYNDRPRIVVHLVREPMGHEKAVPESWEGFPVESRVTGEMRLCVDQEGEDD